MTQINKQFPFSFEPAKQYSRQDFIVFDCNRLRNRQSVKRFD